MKLSVREKRQDSRWRILIHLPALILFWVLSLCVAQAHTVYYNLYYGWNYYQKLDGYVSTQAGSPIVVVIHGGGWRQSDKSDMSSIALMFRNAGFAVVNVNYRLAPTYTFPAQPSDIACAIAYAKRNAKLFKGDSSRVALFGYSAGGHLAALHGVDAPQSRLQGCQSYAGLNVGKVIGCAGVYDFDLCSPYVLQQYVRPMVGDSARYWKTAQPIEHTSVPANPEFLLVHGDQDTDAVWQQSQAFYNALRSHGTAADFFLFPGRNHSTLVSNPSPTDTVFKTVLAFLNDQPLPVQLASFSGTAISDGGVRLEWSTVSEINNYGFEIQKANELDGEYQTLPGSFVTGHGTTLVPQHYVYIDSTASAGQWLYRLKQIDLDGTAHYSNAITVQFSVTDVAESSLPHSTALYQNYPNPFNPTTKIQFTIVNRQLSIVKVYDVLGREVATLIEEVKDPGTYTVEFDGSNLTGGVYFYRLQTSSPDGENANLMLTRKLLLLK